MSILYSVFRPRGENPQNDDQQYGRLSLLVQLGEGKCRSHLESAMKTRKGVEAPSLGGRRLLLLPIEVCVVPQ